MILGMFKFGFNNLYCLYLYPCIQICYTHDTGQENLFDDASQGAYSSNQFSNCWDGRAKLLISVRIQYNTRAFTLGRL